MFKKYFASKSPRKDKEISLVVEGGDKSCVVSASRSMLAKHSAIFRKMLENGELKSSKEVKLKGITAVGLQKIVEYIREDSVYFQSHREAIDTLKAAYLYQVQAMNEICCNFLVTAIECGNVCEIFEFSVAYSFHDVEYRCMKFIDYHAEDVLRSLAFINLKMVTVADIVKRQSLRVTSEVVIFKAVLDWAIQDCFKRGIDSENSPEVFRTAKPLLVHVRFLVMSDAELCDPDIDKIHRLMRSEDSLNRKKSLLRQDSRSGSTNSDSLCMQSREYVPFYNYQLEALECDEHAVRNGESFCLRIEVLKGRVFLTGIALAFERFVSSKNVSCLYAAIVATNVQSSEQKSARGTFMTSNEEAVLKFPSPLMVKESQNVEITLQVKRAVNICSVIIKSDVQIVMGERKDIALKIIPLSSTGRTEKSMFKSIMYFY